MFLHTNVPLFLHVSPLLHLFCETLISLPPRLLVPCVFSTTTSTGRDDRRPPPLESQVAGETEDLKCEISPLVSYDGEAGWVAHEPGTFGT